MSVIGIDPSVDHPAIGIWPSCETWQLAVSGQGSQRLWMLDDAITHTIADIAPSDLQAIFIERPTGGFNNPTLYQANGVIQVAAMRGARPSFPFAVSVFEISPGTWKKEAIGSGRAKKDDVRDWADFHLADKFKQFTQDEADALAIACAGYKLLSKEEGSTG